MTGSRHAFGTAAHARRIGTRAARLRAAAARAGDGGGAHRLFGLRAGQPRHLERGRSELQPCHREPGDQRDGLRRCGVLRPRHAVLRPRRRGGAGAGSGVGNPVLRRLWRRPAGAPGRRMAGGRAARRSDRRLRHAAAHLAVACRAGRRARRHGAGAAGAGSRPLSERAPGERARRLSRSAGAVALRLWSGPGPSSQGRPGHRRSPPAADAGRGRHRRGG